METHSSVLAWRIPWTEKPGRLNEVKFTEEELTGGRTDFFIWAEGRKENFKFYLNILNYIMPT